MTDTTILTDLVRLVTSYPIQTGIVLFFSAWLIGVFRLELSKYR